MHFVLTSKATRKNASFLERFGDINEKLTGMKKMSKEYCDNDKNYVSGGSACCRSRGDL
jgi:hypothetical protein